MEFKGTKGEWDWEENSASQVDDSTCIEVRSGGGPQIAYLQSFVGWGSDYERNATIANAKLIAAAPALLKELQKLREYVINICDVDEDDCHIEHPLMSSQTAISKALGEE